MAAIVIFVDRTYIARLGANLVKINNTKKMKNMPHELSFFSEPK